MSKKRGFTLTEVIVAMAIGSVLCSMIIVVAHSFACSHKAAMADNKRIMEVNYIYRRFDLFVNKCNLNGDPVSVFLNEHNELRAESGGRYLSYNNEKKEFITFFQTMQKTTFERIENFEFELDNKALKLTITLDNGENLFRIHRIVGNLQ